MILKHLKQQMLLPIEEYIINERVHIRGRDVLILSFTVDKEKNRLWIIYEEKSCPINEIDCEYREKIKTNREEKLHSIEEHSRHKEFYIKQIEIQGQIVNFSSSRNSHINNSNLEEIMQLQHFIEKGLIPEEWDDINLENLVIAQYEQMEEEITPSIDKTKELDIKLYINQSFIEKPIQHCFKVDFGKQNIGTKIVYYDKELGRESCFFINEIYSFDIYEDIKEKAEKIEDREIRDKNLNIFMEGLKNVCPRGKNLAVIKYETVDNIQLNFYIKDYLEATPIYSNSSIGIIGRTNKNEIGINGYRLRECVLQPIDKDFSGELEIELFSQFLEIPEESVKSIR
ncbi:hypothetical protein KQI41_13925 [Tissierella pigra]|uniref:Uncharacterized protein n=1 Tax=Tissierella pigra TaxID=2607614 RepID=A0A6N7XNV6_9FIRM|nr:hypothetical protein [Tissierella pigra]MBU5427486.1 hypothetical protein [Tissierella pigra]MSU03176.1 hypothetical protein [Tissierella pigra]